MTAGTYGDWEPGMEHFVWIKGLTVTQFHDIGSRIVKYTAPQDDPRNQGKEGK